MPTTKELRATYQSLADQAATFDRETTLQLRKRDDDQKTWLAERKAVKGILMQKKLAASVAMNEAESAQSEAEKQAEAERERLTAEQAKREQEAPPAKNSAKPAPVAAHAATSERRFEDKDAHRPHGQR